MITVKAFPNNPLGENTYILSDGSRQAAIIDCGALTRDEREAIRQYILQESLHPVRALLTHGHFDHIFGAQWVFDTYGLQPEMQEADIPLYQKGCQQIKEMFGTHLQFTVPAPAPPLHDGDTIALGEDMRLQAIATPGHTPGGCCYFMDGRQPIVFTGDSLFRGSIGRTDFPGGNYRQLITSLRDNILTLPPSTTVYPGHGPASSIEEELSSPYFM